MITDIAAYGLVFYGLDMVMAQSFKGAGDTKIPTLFNFIGFWLIEIPLTWVFALLLGLEQRGVFYAIIVAESIMN